MCRHLCKGTTSGGKCSSRLLLTLLTEHLQWKLWILAVTWYNLTTLKSCTTDKDNLPPQPFTDPPKKTRYHKKAWEISRSITLPMLPFPYNVWKNCILHSTSFTFASWVPKHSIIPEQALTLRKCWVLQSHLSIKGPLPPAQKPHILQNTLTICLLSL